MLGTLKRFVGRHPAARTDPLAAEVAAIEALGIFDRDAYLASNPDVADCALDPVRHYVEHGAREGRNPCACFDSAYYLAANADVAVSGANPLLHYFTSGWREGRNPSAAFDADWYAARHLGSARGSVNPLHHYLTFGRDRGLEVRAILEPVVAAIRESGLFDETYYLDTYDDLREAGIDPVAHYVAHGAREGRNPNAFFDTRYYLKHNRDVAGASINPLLHFHDSGWRELRNPHPDFDVWWYWSTHLDPSGEEVNPLAHYLAVGRTMALETRPPPPPAQFAGSGWRHGQAPPRRVCLFAGYDPHGIVDDYVVDYLRELSRHADIHYLADCDMAPGELEKIAQFVKSAHAERHGEYDFGSYSRLVKRVGWDAIARYDELILANDSCYLLRGLDDVFARMDARACDWWGMQATKGLASTRRNPRNRFLQPIPMSAVRASMLAGFERDYQYDFHVGSYFVAFRQPVVADPGFRNLVDSVVAQPSKRNLILKYEVGLTRLLVARGFAFDTLVDCLYPFHPLFTNWYFQLLDEGFPFLKRYLLSNNHYRVPRLAAWKEKVLRKVPGADVAAMERNLERVVDPEVLERNLHIGTSVLVDDMAVPAELLDDEAFLAADQSTPKYAHWWAFPVCAFTSVFSGNERAIFEQVRSDPSIRKIVLTRDKAVHVEGENVDIVPLRSPEGQQLLMRAGHVFIKHSPTRNLVFPVAAHLRNVINVWHGIPLKRIGHASLDMQHHKQAIAMEHLRCRAVISSSKIDTLAMAAAFYPLEYGDIWATGLPRNDFILRALAELPADMQAVCARLRNMVAGRRLVLFMPTFRNAQQGGYYRFSGQEIDWLAGWLDRNNAVLGIREHMADSARVYSEMLQPLSPLDLSATDFPDAELLYREAALLVTDYSSCFFDFMLTGRPAVSFAYDHEAYASIERGFFYELDMVFPGPVCHTFGELRAALDGAFDPPTEARRAELDLKRRMFFDHVDDRNAARLVARVKQLSDTEQMGARLMVSA